jgi:hypothetical protein
MFKKSLKHLISNNMTYWQHLCFAFYYGIICLITGLRLIIHALFPCWFQTSGSDLVQSMAIVFKKYKRIDDT